jgi:ribonuclease HI
MKKYSKIKKSHCENNINIIIENSLDEKKINLSTEECHEFYKINQDWNDEETIKLLKLVEKKSIKKIADILQRPEDNIIEKFKNLAINYYLYDNKTIEEIEKYTKLSKEDITETINNYKLKTKNDINFIPDYYVYTDGACSNNGKNNALAGIGIFFGIDDERNTSKRIEGKQSNNTAELSAIIETYDIIKNDIIDGKKIIIVSDSIYAINCASSYGEKCYKKNWNVDIPNKELVKKVYEMYKDKPNIQFIHIKAHTNNTDNHSIGNDYADKFANQAIKSCNNNYDTTKKIYLIVPFIKKEEIKKLGGIWDINKKKWFIYDNNQNINKILLIFSRI